jgi:hypothetical protein
MVTSSTSRKTEYYVKLNVDAGFSVDSGTGSSGAIIRDERGFFLAASFVVFLLYRMQQLKTWA